MSNAFADFAKPKPQPEPREPSPYCADTIGLPDNKNRKRGRTSDMSKQREETMTIALNMLDTGTPAVVVSVMLGRSRTWLANSIAEFPEDHPVRVRYRNIIMARRETSKISPRVTKSLRQKVSKGITLMEKGMSAIEAEVAICGISSRWLSSAASRMSEKDPLKKRYKKLAPKWIDRRHDERDVKIRQCLDLMREKDISGAKACKELGFRHTYVHDAMYRAPEDYPLRLGILRTETQNGSKET